LIGQDFWNFLLKSKNGYEVVKNAFRKYAASIENDLKELRKIYGIE